MFSFIRESFALANVRKSRFKFFSWNRKVLFCYDLSQPEKTPEKNCQY